MLTHTEKEQTKGQKQLIPPVNLLHLKLSATAHLHYMFCCKQCYVTSLQYLLYTRARNHQDVHPWFLQEHSAP